jgi:hypothetical protein
MVHALAAAAGVGLVRVVEHELRRQLGGLVVDRGADQEQHGLGIDQDGHALVLDHLVDRPLLGGVFEDVFRARAAAVLHADPQAGIGLVGAVHDLLHPRGGGRRSG